ncbi:MOSC N-terminal beta barrel domain-containing protein [Pseudohaliea sp.]|uniref:MOSC domain-containing protein n=1 Tax=Pseudohaliea sp. TaxID=2740289 RepID=UPI0032EB00B8
MAALRLAAIYRYPLKSAAGLSCAQATVDHFGVAGDRRWLLVDPAGDFLSQRRLPALALLQAEERDDGLVLAFGGAQLAVPGPAAGAPARAVTVWGDRVMALDAGEAAADWLGERLGTACRLVYMPDDCRRPVDPAYAPAGRRVNFADGFPLLLLTQASLDGLNARLPTPVPMDRFRPNLVIDGAAPHAEDGWRRLRIGAVTVDLVKPCSRCAIPSIDQATAARDPHINRVLAGYRRRDGAVLFGQNGLHDGPGTLAVGDPVTVLA